MSSLPLISHRLFVAAVRQEDRIALKAAPTERGPADPHPSARPVSFEVLGPADLVREAASSLRASLSASQRR